MTVHLNKPAEKRELRTSNAVVNSYLELSGIRKMFGEGDSGVEAISSVDLAVNREEFLAIVGPSGCGKSTLLQIVAGLASATDGSVQLDGRSVISPPPEMVYLFQQYSRSLFPWLTVQKNVQFAFDHRTKASSVEKEERCKTFLEMVGLSDFAKHYPWQLSGGMQQRVAIARALAAEPSVLLLDEPFSAVDALTRLDLHSLILRLWAERRFTAILVTHDVDEAIFLADRVAVLSNRPSTIAEIMTVDLPRPRDPVTTKEQPRFLELRHHLLTRLLKRTPDERE